MLLTVADAARGQHSPSSVMNEATGEPCGTEVTQSPCIHARPFGVSQRAYRPARYKAGSAHRDRRSVSVAS